MNDLTTNELMFENEQLEYIIDEQGEIWFSAEVIGRALDYKNPSMSINVLYNREKELLDQYSRRIIIYPEDKKVSGAPIRVFNHKGVYLICMKSSMPRAVKFQMAVAELLDSIRKQEKFIVTKEQVELELERIKTNRLYLASDLLKDLEKNEAIDQRWISHSKMLIVAEITGQRLDFEMEINLSDFLKTQGHKATDTELISFGRVCAQTYRLIKGKEPKKTNKQLRTGIRKINYYTVEDLPIIQRAYREWKDTNQTSLVDNLNIECRTQNTISLRPKGAN